MTLQANSPTLARCEARAEIARIASEHGAGNVRVFGSAGRGEPDAHDLDLLVEMAPGRNLLDLIALSNELEDALGIEVDVLSENGLRPTCEIASSPKPFRFEERAHLSRRRCASALRMCPGARWPACGAS